MLLAASTCVVPLPRPVDPWAGAGVPQGRVKPRITAGATQTVVLVLCALATRMLPGRGGRGDAGRRAAVPPGG